LLKGARDTVAIVDIGARSTDICIVDNGVARISHNFDSAGIDMTKAYGSLWRVDLAEAEKNKKAVACTVMGKTAYLNKSLKKNILSILNIIVKGRLPLKFQAGKKAWKFFRELNFFWRA